ncbi:unnamed protein product [Linum trigynum]|uniref:Uncharacterized protein n=1 Tax=Linum trigynum TaxID=586398 RepID=A0AAV2GII3_9ROSI
MLVTDVSLPTYDNFLSPDLDSGAAIKPLDMLRLSKFKLSPTGCVSIFLMVISDDGFTERRIEIGCRLLWSGSGDFVCLIDKY